MINKASKVLIKARSVLEEYEWVRHDLAKDECDNPVSACSINACKFCALGALWRASNSMGIYPANAQLYLEHVMGAIASRNDHPDTRKEHILMAYDFAILMAQEDEHT
jgi:hypothetical protein